MPQPRFFRTLKAIEVHLSAETEKKLKDLSAQSGRGTDDLVEDAMAGYFDEVRQVREMLDGRYDDLGRGFTQPARAVGLDLLHRRRQGDGLRQEN